MSRMSMIAIAISTMLVIAASLIVTLVPTRDQRDGYGCPISLGCLPSSYPVLTVGDMYITGNLTLSNTTTLGLITSVDIVAPSDIFDVTSPVFFAGPAVLSFESKPQQPHTFWAGPDADLLASTPAFRHIGATDLPVVPAERGGTNNNASLLGNRVMISGNDQIYESDPLFDGFLVIGQTGGPPVPAALVPGAGVQIVNGPGTISIAATGACLNGTKFSQSCMDISNLMCPSGALNTDCIPGTMTFNTLYVDNLIAINSTQQTIISANASVLQVEHLVADRVQLSGDFECIAGALSGFGNIASNCYDISGKTCTSPVDNTCLPLRIDTINGIAPDSITYDFGVTSGGAGLTVTPTTNGIIVSNTGVTSVALDMPSSIFGVSGSPVTTTGTLTASLNTQLANTILAGPVTGAAAAPTFRPQVLADLPQLTDGQLYVGSTGTSVAAATLTAGSGISVTNGAGSITIATVGGGTVTSVALAMPAMFTVSGSPVTTSGTLTASLATQTANTVLAGPSSGAAAAPTFRTLGIADVSGALGYQFNTGVVTITISSGVITTITGATSPAGTYFVSFSASVDASAAPCRLIVAICNAGVPVQNSYRYIQDPAGQVTVHSQVVLTASGSALIAACWWRDSGACTFSMYYRSIFQLRIAS